VYGDGIGLLTAGRCRAPDFLVDIAKIIEVLFFPEKIGVIRGDGVDKIHEFPGIFTDAGQVITDGFDAGGPQSLGDPGLEKLLFPVMEVDAALLVDDIAELIELSFRNVHRRSKSIPFLKICPLGLFPNLQLKST